jgi:DNA anti-recombination protein RmuC
LHVIKRAEDSEEGGAEWSGRLRAIKDSVSKVATTVSDIGERIGAMEGTLNNVMEKQEVSQGLNSIESKLDMRVGAIQTTLDMRVGAIETTLDTRVGAIEAQLNTIIAQLLLVVPASAQSKPTLAEANPTWSDGPIPPPIAKLQSWAASIVGQNKK